MEVGVSTQSTQGPFLHRMGPGVGTKGVQGPTLSGHLAQNSKESKNPKFKPGLPVYYAGKFVSIR